MAGPLPMLFIMANVHAAMIPAVFRVDMPAPVVADSIVTLYEGHRTSETLRVNMFTDKQDWRIGRQDVRTLPNTSGEVRGAAKKNVLTVAWEDREEFRIVI